MSFLKGRGQRLLHRSYLKRHFDNILVVHSRYLKENLANYVEQKVI